METNTSTIKRNLVGTVHTFAHVQPTNMSIVTMLVATCILATRSGYPVPYDDGPVRVRAGTVVRWHCRPHMTVWTTVTSGPVASILRRSYGETHSFIIFPS